MKFNSALKIIYYTWFSLQAISKLYHYKLSKNIWVDQIVITVSWGRMRWDFETKSTGETNLPASLTFWPACIAVMRKERRVCRQTRGDNWVATAPCWLLLLPMLKVDTISTAWISLTLSKARAPKIFHNAVTRCAKQSRDNAFIRLLLLFFMTYTRKSE